MKLEIHKIGKKKFNFENITAYSLFLISALLGWRLNNNGTELNEVAFITLSVISISLIIFLLLTQRKRVERINSTIVGHIEFLPEKVIILNREIDPHDIEKFDLQIRNYNGEYLVPTYADLRPALSKGIDNILSMRLKSGEKIKMNIKIDFDGQEIYLKETLINLMNLGAISVKKVTDLLRLENYNEIQKFKKEHYR